MKALKLVLRLNAASCLLFGLLFVIWPTQVAQFIGTDLELVILIVGAGLILNGLHLSYASTRKKLIPAEVYNFSLGDIIWFCATCIFIANGFIITTWAGIWVGIFVAIMVLALGLAQLWFYAELNDLGVKGDEMMPAELSRLTAIVNSWLAMKPWVKNWLHFLNGLFVLSLFFFPLPVAKYIIMGTIICIPFLLAGMFLQRGLTRLLGLAHLIPWLPLWLYIVLALTTNIVGMQITFATAPYLFGYLTIFITALTACLLLDILDVYRWFKGNHHRLGAPNAR